MDVKQLRQIRGTIAFPDWNAEQREDVEALLRGTVDALLSLGPSAAETAVMHRLREAVDRLNEMDETGGFIETMEREDLCDVLYRIGEAAGVSPDEEWVDEYRDW